MQLEIHSEIDNLILMHDRAHFSHAVAIYHICGLRTFGHWKALSSLAWRYCAPLTVVNVQHEVV